MTPDTASTTAKGPLLRDITPVVKRRTPAAEKKWFTIGDVARRSGVAASALRFYESQGLIAGERTEGGHRQYPREVLRRIGFIRAAQNVGLALPEIAAALHTLPEGSTPTKADWGRLAKSWRPKIDKRIAALQRLSAKLDGCIGCGCLSMKACALYNPDDAAAQLGRGARYLLGDKVANAVPVGTVGVSPKALPDNTRPATSEQAEHEADEKQLVLF